MRKGKYLLSESKKNKQRAFYSWLTWYCFIKGVKPFTKFDWINHQLQGEGAMMFGAGS